MEFGRIAKRSAAAARDNMIALLLTRWLLPMEDLGLGREGNQSLRIANSTWSRFGGTRILNQKLLCRGIMFDNSKTLSACECADEGLIDVGPKPP